MRFALIGCGAISKKHVEAIARIERASVAAVCDQAPDIARAVGERLHVPYYTDAIQLAEKQQPDVFVVLTPSGVHAANILELIPFRKHFVVEKPLTLQLAEADRIIEACDTGGCKLFVVQQNRFNPPVVKLKEAIVSGRFGKLVLATARVRWCRRQEYYDEKPWRGTWALDGGVLSNQANHHIDMLTWLAGPVDTVKAMGARRLANIEAEDTAAAIFSFHGGALGVIEATTATRPGDLEGSISVLGEKGAVEIGGFYMNELKTWQFETALPEDRDAFEAFGHTPGDFAWNHTAFYRDVIQSIESDTRGIVDGLEGRRSLELISAIYESIETGHEVALRFVPRHVRLGQI